MLRRILNALPRSTAAAAAAATTAAVAASRIPRISFTAISQPSPVKGKAGKEAGLSFSTDTADVAGDVEAAASFRGFSKVNRPQFFARHHDGGRGFKNPNHPAHRLRLEAVIAQLEPPHHALRHMWTNAVPPDKGLGLASLPTTASDASRAASLWRKAAGTGSPFKMSMVVRGGAGQEKFSALARAMMRHEGNAALHDLHLDTVAAAVRAARAASQEAAAAQAQAEGRAHLQPVRQPGPRSLVHSAPSRCFPPG